MNQFKEKTALILFGSLFSISILFNFGGDYYWGKWAGFISISLLFIAIKTAKKFGTTAAITFFYMMASASWVLFFPGNKYQALPADELVLLKFYIADSVLRLCLIIAPFFFLNASKPDFRKYGGWFACLFLFLSLPFVFGELLIYGCKIDNACGGALRNPSLNASMMAFALPLAFKHLDRRVAWGLAALALASGVIGKTNIGIGLVCLACLFHVAWGKRISILLAAATVTAAAFFVAGQLMGHKFLTTSGRFVMWDFFMSQWVFNKQVWLFGTAFGSFSVFAVDLQQKLKFATESHWLWMHNDWLESLFTTGIVGLTLSVSTYCAVFHGLRKKGFVPELQSLALLGIAMCMNPIAHIGLLAAFMAWLTALALFRPQKAEPLLNGRPRR